MYRFAFRGRFLVGHIVVLALAVLFVRLGIWQLTRLHQEREREATIRARLAATPALITDLTHPGAGNAEALSFRRVAASGTFDAAHQMLVRFRQLNGVSGDYVVMPLVLPSGDGVLVVRGWVAAGDDEGTTQEPVVTPSGPVEVKGLFLPSEEMKGAGPLVRGGSVVESSRISVGLMQPELPYRLEPGYIQLQSQDPAVRDVEPQVLPPPDFTQAPPHFSYMVQWFVFALTGLVGWPLLLRRAARERAREDAPGAEDAEEDRRSEQGSPAATPRGGL